MSKKILIIAASLKIGGAEKVARDIGLYCAERGFEPHFVVFHQDDGDYDQEILSAGGKIIHLPKPSEGYPAHLSALRKLMKEHRYYAVHAHTMFNCGWAMLVARQMKVPVRISHAHSALDNGNGFVKRVYEAIMRMMILCCSTDLIACGEKAGVRLFGANAFSKRGKLILNGVDANTFRFNEEKRQTIRKQCGWEDAFLVGHVGHLAAVKNQSFLLDLMPMILQERPNARLLMLGEGEDRSKLEKKLHDMGLSDKVRMPGNVSNVSDYLSAMDVFVFPSLYEGMPLSILEVQANGLPCVISNGVPKDVYLTDLLIPLDLEEDKKKWAETILCMSRNNPEIYAAQLIDAGFDLNGSLEKVYHIYNREQS